MKVISINIKMLNIYKIKKFSNTSYSQGITDQTVNYFLIKISP